MLWYDTVAFLVPMLTWIGRVVWKEA